MIDRLHDQAPSLFAQMLIGLERTAFRLPLAIGPVHQPRFDLFLAGEPGQFVGADQVFEIFEALADYNGFLLPIIGEEVFDGRIGKVKSEHSALREEESSLIPPACEHELNLDQESALRQAGVVAEGNALTASISA